MNDTLSIDEYAALKEIATMPQGGRPSACVARNTKRLSGLKYIAHQRSGALSLTDKGKQALFVKNCIDGLRKIADDPAAQIDAGALTFLIKKGHVIRDDATGLLQLTERGSETLADIDAASA